MDIDFERAMILGTADLRRDVTQDLVDAENEYKELLLKKWKPTLEHGEKIESDEMKLTVAQCCENTFNFLLNNGGTKFDGFGNPMGELKYDREIANIVIPAVRTILPTMPILKMVGCDAMHGPVGKTPVYRFEGYGCNFISKVLESHTYKMSSWSVNEDWFNLTIENLGKIINTARNDIQSFILNELVKEVILDGENRDVLNREGLTSKDILESIDKKANKIAESTRRGNGNVVIATKDIVEILKPNWKGNGEDCVEEVGIINDGKQLLLCDNIHEASYFIVGYRGSHESDCGMIYAPYIPFSLDKNSGGTRTRAGWASDSISNYYKMVEVK